MSRLRLFAGLALGVALAWTLSIVAAAQMPRAEAEAEDFAPPHNEAGDASADERHTTAGDAEHASATAPSSQTGQGGSNPLAIDPDLSICTLVVFLILLAVLWKFAWGPIASGLDKRQHGIEEQIRLAHQSNEEAKRLLAQYEQKLADAAGEVRGILEEARRDAEHTQEDILAKARADAQLERDRALRDIERATDQALKELAEHSANLAVDLAARIVQTKLTPAEQSQLVREAMERFQQQATPSAN